jgi:hypothetical protein
MQLIWKDEWEKIYLASVRFRDRFEIDLLSV